MKYLARKILVSLLATVAGAASANCITDTDQGQFQAGVASNVDLISTPGSVKLATAGGGGGGIDQQNTSFTANGEKFNTSQWAAQTFKPGVSGSLTRVDVNVFNLCVAAAPPISLSIRATSGGLPTGSDLASGSFTITAQGTQLWYTVNFAAPTTVTAGTQYAIVLRASGTVGTSCLGFSDSAVNGNTGNDVYAGGLVAFSTNSGSSWAVETQPTPSVDAAFKTYVSSATSGFVSAGDLISSIKDSNPPAGTTPTWTTLSWTASVAGNTTLKFQAAAANSTTSAFAFVGPDGTASSFFTSSNADLSQFNGNRYLKYRAFLSTGSSSATPLLNDATACFSSASTSTSSDVSITNTDGSDTEVPGTTVTYSIVASNAGPNDVSRATVSDAFPAPLTSCHWTCAGSAGGTCSASGSGNIGDNTVTLPVGGQATYTATCTLPASATGSVANTATITNPAGVDDPVPDNNTATDTDRLTPQVDLAVTINDGAVSQTAGLSATYTMLSSNAGPSDAPNTMVVDTFPSSLTCTWTCAGTLGGSCTASGSGNINTAVNLPKGGRATFTATCSIASSASGSLVDTVSVSPANGVAETNPGNNSATDSDTLVVKPDVALTMTDNQDMVQVGSPVDYVMQVTNLGPSDAAVNLTDNLPSQLSTKASWVCTGTGGAVCTKGSGNAMNTSSTIPAGGVATYVYSSSVVSDDAANSITNVAVAHVNNGNDPNGANNSASDTDAIVVFLSGFEGGQAAAAMKVTAGGGSSSMTAQFGVDGGLLNNLGPAPVTVATGQAGTGTRLFDLQLIRLGSDVLMRSVVPIDNTAFSDISPWETVDLGQHLLRLQWQSASSRGDDGYLRAGSPTQEALVAANNADQTLTQIKVKVENNIPWLVLLDQ